jgi:hypothetical protein
MADTGPLKHRMRWGYMIPKCETVGLGLWNVSPQYKFLSDVICYSQNLIFQGTYQSMLLLISEYLKILKQVLHY